MNKVRTGGGRIGYLDALRGFAILFVIEGHVRIFGMGIKSYDTLSALMLYTFYLPVFFFVSGYLAYKVSLANREILQNGLKKFMYLLLPAVFFSIIYNLYSHKNLMSPIYMGFGKYWFTITLFECFFVYYLIMMVLKSERWRSVALIVISLMGIGVLSYTSSIGPKLLDANHLCKYFYFFVFGIFARQYQPVFDSIVKNEVAKAFTIISFFVLLFLMDYQLLPGPVFHLLRDVVLRVLGTAMVVMLFASHATFFEGSSRVARIFNEIGRISLPIYLLQYFFVPDFGYFQNQINGMDQFTVHIISAVYTILITATCYVFIMLLEQSKFVKKYILGLK